MTGPRCAVLPDGEVRHLHDAVRSAGGRVVAVEDAEALIWTAPRTPGELRAVLSNHPDIRWVQLPSAGIEHFVNVLDQGRTWTSGKGVNAEPVAEHALALALAGLRHVAAYARRGSWTGPVGRNLIGARVTILGGGGIARSLIRLLHPFRVQITVVRHRPAPIPGVADVVGLDDLHGRLSRSDLVVLGLALTPSTELIIDATALGAMPRHAWLVNVSRGRHIETQALVHALDNKHIGGAALDVTDPEPLPAGHPLWSMENCIVTPHVGNTPEMFATLLAGRVRDNVRRYADGQKLEGLVDVSLGY